MQKFRYDTALYNRNWLLILALVLHYFAHAKAGIVLDLFLNCEQKWTSYSYKEKTFITDGNHIASHAFFPKIWHHIVASKHAKKIHIRFRITEVEKNLEFLRLFPFFVVIFAGFCFVTSYILGRIKFENVLGFVGSHHNKSLKKIIALAGLQFTLLWATNFNFKINKKRSIRAKIIAN